MAIRQNHALGALAVCAKNALVGMVLGMVTENANAVREKGGGNRFTFYGRKLLPLPKKIDRGARRDRQDRVGMDPESHLSYVALLFRNRSIIVAKPRWRILLPFSSY